MLTTVAALAVSCHAGPITTPPDTSWVAGEYSSTNLEGDPVLDVLRLSLSEDGEALLYSVYGCGPTGTTTEAQAYAWALEDDEVIIFDLLGNDVLVTQVDCNTIELIRIDSGLSFGVWSRGRMCLEKIPYGCPNGTQCDECQTVWCEAPPPMCE